MKFLRDPNPDLSQGGGAIPPIVAPVPPVEPQVPKDKEGWEKLSQENPQQWIKWTQPRMDQAVREARENKEKAIAAEQRARNLEVELENIRRGLPEKKLELPGSDNSEKPLSKENLPQSDQQWDQLWIENPNLAADLRHFKNEQDRQTQEKQSKIQSEHQKAWKDNVIELSSRHSDMYLQKKNAEGKVEVDAQGKPVLIINPHTGLPIPDLESEKFKFFDEVYREDSDGYGNAKYGTRYAMLEMEKRLQERGKQQIQAQHGPGATSVQDQRGVMPGGVPPPVMGNVSFKSPEEEQHAKRAVERGIYKSIDEYCQLRDGKNTGFAEESRIPKFG